MGTSLSSAKKKMDAARLKEYREMQRVERAIERLDKATSEVVAAWREWAQIEGGTQWRSFVMIQMQTRMEELN